MAYRSDTSNRKMDNAIIETILQGELSFDYSISIPDTSYDEVEEELEGLEVEISEDFSRMRERVEILYNEEDQDAIYSLFNRVLCSEI